MAEVSVSLDKVTVAYGSTAALRDVCNKKNIELLLALISTIDVSSREGQPQAGEADLKTSIQQSLLAIERQITNTKLQIYQLSPDFLSVAALAFVFHWIDAARYPSVPFALFSGGLMLGAVYMATDPVTAPITNRGRWIFGIGIGVLVVLIRNWGGLPEGVVYAILIMNALVPFINRATQPRIFGTGLPDVDRRVAQ